MTILDLIILIIVIGVLLWLVNAYIPMDQKIKTILNIVVVVILCLYLLRIFGILGALNAPIERIR